MNWYRLRNHVLQGKAKRTSSGLKAKDLGYSASTGKVVLRRASESAKSRYPGSKLEFWNKCAAEARWRLGLACTFCPMKGKSDKGQQLYVMTKAIQRMRSEAPAPDGVKRLLMRTDFTHRGEAPSDSATWV